MKFASEREGGSSERGWGHLERGSGARGFLRKVEVETLEETVSIQYHLFISSPFAKSINVSQKIEVRHPTCFSLKHDIDLI